MDAFAALLERGPKLVAVTHVSNVLGTENPLAEISRLAHEAGALVLADGAQAAPKLPLDVAELGVDFYALTGHKLYAPTGIGALWTQARPAARDAALPRRRLDDPQGDHARARPTPTRPARFEAGTPAIAQAIGMASALRWLDGLGMDAVLRARARDRRLRAGAARRGAGPAHLRPAARRRSGSARSPSSSRASTPTTSPRSSTATASPSAPATTAPSR